MKQEKEHDLEHEREGERETDFPALPLNLKAVRVVTTERTSGRSGGIFRSSEHQIETSMTVAAASHTQIECWQVERRTEPGIIPSSSRASKT